MIRGELNAAGFSDISVDAVDDRSKASSPDDPAIAYCQGTPLRNEIEARDHPACKKRRNRRLSFGESIWKSSHRGSYPSIRDHRHSLKARRT